MPADEKADKFKADILAQRVIDHNDEAEAAERKWIVVASGAQYRQCQEEGRRWKGRRWGEQAGQDYEATGQKAPDMPPMRGGGRSLSAVPEATAGALARKPLPLGYMPNLPPLFVREYAHQRSVGMTPEMRSDWAETLCWQPALVLANGQAEVSFDLCDSTTTFQVTAFAHTLDGRLKRRNRRSAGDSPATFTLTPKLPIEVTASDKIDVPLSLTNNTGEKACKVSVRVKDLDGLAAHQGRAERRVRDASSACRCRKLYRFQPTIQDGDATTLTFEGKTAPFAADMVRNTFRVVPEGFPFVAFA